MKKLLYSLVLASMVMCWVPVFGSTDQTDNPYKFSEITEQEYRAVIERFIDCVKNNKVKELAKLVNYPFGREYPIPDVISPEDFVLRYNQFFDEKLIAEISQSDISKDWDTAGWRGIMFDHGTLWLNYDGTLRGTNYTTEYEKNLRKKLIEELRAKLHPSLQKFHEPGPEYKTDKFLIRIDDMGGEKYRYAAWSLPKTSADQPDIVIGEGTITVEGTACLTSYTFKNGAYTYVVDFGVPCGPELGFLEIFKGENQILRQELKLA